MKQTTWHWPDHVIGKRESRRLREEHNTLANSHHELLVALEDSATLLSVWPESDLTPGTVREALILEHRSRLAPLLTKAKEMGHEWTPGF